MLLILASTASTAATGEDIRITREDLGMIAVAALFILGPAWIIGRRLIRPSRKTPSKTTAKESATAKRASAAQDWQERRMRGVTEQFQGVQVKGGLLPKSALMGGFNVHYDGDCPQWHSVRGSTTVYKTDGNLQVFIPQGFSEDVDFIGNIVDVYRTNRSTYDYS